MRVQRFFATARGAGVAFLVVAVHTVLLWWNGWVHSIVRSEDAHLGSGLSHCCFMRFDLYRVNPPLIRVVASLPVVASRPVVQWGRYSVGSRDRCEYLVGADFLDANGAKTIGLIQRARWVCISFSLLGAWVCFRWAKVLSGMVAGLLAIILWCLSPYILGHGATIMPDVPSAAMGVAAVYCFWQWLREPGWLRVIVGGVALGLAELCKFTLLIFYPLLPLLWLAYRLPAWRSRAFTRSDWLRQGAMVASLLLLSVYIINCGYLFEDTLTPLEEFRFQTTMFTGCDSLNDVPPEGANRFAGTWIGKLPVPLPANMVQGIDTQRYDFERGAAVLFTRRVAEAWVVVLLPLCPGGQGAAGDVVLSGAGHGRDNLWPRLQCPVARRDGRARAGAGDSRFR